MVSLKNESVQKHFLNAYYVVTIVLDSRGRSSQEELEV